MIPQARSTTPKHIRDRLRTPDFITWWLGQRFNFAIDLAAERGIEKFPLFLCKEQDALTMDWHKLPSPGFCNPPYSDPKSWLKKAWTEAQLGYTSVFYLPNPNGEESFRDYAFGKASTIIYINGRIAHLAPEDFIVKGKNNKPDKHYKKGDEVSGNTRGSCVLVYDRDHEGDMKTEWINRDDIKAAYQHFLAQQEHAA
ncbi:DNA N-6-adenine-methyltransferase [Methylophaga sp.]|uniref:DNA N-6-adenine-methyltransferase n=1 Tax=Methylophaga sp. TaxID=2024840 RepID=UPI003A93C134